MRVSARVDYGVRVLVELAAESTRPVTCEAIAESQGIPYRFLKSVVRDLRAAGLVRSQRGCEGGYWLGRPADGIRLAEVAVAVDGELFTVNGEVPEESRHPAPAERVDLLWRGLRARLGEVFEGVTIADLAGERPGETAAAVFAAATAEG